MLKTKEILISSLVGATLLLVCFTSSARISTDLEDRAAERLVDIRMLLKRHVPADAIDVHVHNNTMQFAGFVENQQQFKNVKAVAEKYAADYRIVNNVEILASKEKPKDPVKLKREIKRMLQDNRYPVGDIDVQVRDGHVILSGFVSEGVQLGKLQSLVEAVPGTLSVGNYLLYKEG
jgi:osmotically-inducible protein OsmY